MDVLRLIHDPCVDTHLGLLCTPSVCKGELFGYPWRDSSVPTSSTWLLYTKDSSACIKQPSQRCLVRKGCSRKRVRRSLGTCTVRKDGGLLRTSLVFLGISNFRSTDSRSLQRHWVGSHTLSGATTLTFFGPWGGRVLPVVVERVPIGSTQGKLR